MFKKVLPPDDSSLQWSQQGGGITEDPARVLGKSYKRLVTRVIAGATQDSRSDEEIVKLFKTKLGRMVANLSEKKIETKDYQYGFQIAWKNNIWHLYEPLSFDLVDPNSIREKVNRWLGCGVAPNDAREKFKIHFILGEPRQPGTKEAFENALHLLQKFHGQKQLVRENEVQHFAEPVTEEIISHDAEALALRDKPKQK